MIANRDCDDFDIFFRNHPKNLHCTWLVWDTMELFLEQFSLLVLPSLLTNIPSSLLLLKSSLLTRPCSLNPPLLSASPDKQKSVGYL